MRKVVISVLGMLSVALFGGCVSTGPTQLGVSTKKWTTLSENEKQKMRANYDQIQKAQANPKKVFDGPELIVYMLDGKAMMPPFKNSERFYTDQFEIMPGKCSSTSLHSVDTAQSVELRTCYDGRTLAFDPSAYNLKQAKGTVFFTYNPIWKRGFTYSKVFSSGYARLSNAKITIKALQREKTPGL